MLIAACAPALVAAATRRAPPLWLLLAAAQLADIALFVLTLAGIEHYAVEPFYTAMDALFLYDAPFSHSFLGTLGLSAALGVAIRLGGGGSDAAWIGGAVVAAHWFLDLVFHASDLTLAGGVRRFGFGLWNHPYVAMPLALGLIFLALTFYANHTRPRGRLGTPALILLTITLTGFQLADWLTPMPRVAADPAPAALAIRGLAIIVVLTVLAGWTGATRRACPARPALAPSPPADTGDGR